MKYPLKEKLLEFLLMHNDFSDETKKLINSVTEELNYADTMFMDISTEDLENYHKQKLLKNVLHKKDNNYTIEDCRNVANIIDTLYNECFENILDRAFESIDRNT